MEKLVLKMCISLTIKFIYFLTNTCIVLYVGIATYVHHKLIQLIITMRGLLFIFNVYSDFTEARDFCVQFNIGHVCSYSIYYPWIRIFDDIDALIFIGWVYNTVSGTYT